MPLPAKPNKKAGAGHNSLPQLKTTTNLCALCGKRDVAFHSYWGSPTPSTALFAEILGRYSHSYRASPLLFALILGQTLMTLRNE